MRYDEKLSAKRAWARFFGTLGGAAMASIALAFITDPTVVVLIGALFAVLNGLFKLTRARKMPLFDTATILLLYTANDLTTGTENVLTRVFYNVVGITIGFLVVIYPFPRILKRINPKTPPTHRRTDDAMTFHEWMELAAQIFEGLGAVVLLAGLFTSRSSSRFAFRSSGDGRRAYKVLRESFGQFILLGLEILVAADLVRTVAVAPTMENVAILGMIVLIRTILSFSLEIEIEGVAPWRRAATSGPTRVATSVQRSRETT